MAARNVRQGKTYLALLSERAKESHVHRKHQLIGLEIAEILGDARHKALYIKLAKERDAGELLRIAKDVAERPHVKNRGAYFMRLLSPKRRNGYAHFRRGQ